MKLDKNVPKPYPDPDSGIYYTNFRIPADLVPHYNKTHIQKTLRTRDKKKAKDLNDERWFLLLREFDRIRRERTLGVSLTEEFIPHLLDEWLHFSLREDEELRLRCSSARTNENSEHGNSSQGSPDFGCHWQLERGTLRIGGNLKWSMVNLEGYLSSST